MMQYTIVKSNSLDVNWQAIQALQINQFPWYSSGQKQATHIKLTYTDKELIIQIEAEDNHSFAQQTQLNHMLICEDSCVEFFFSPSGILGSPYINLEVNCCGTLHLAYGPDRHSRTFIPLELAGKIKRTPSIKSPVKLESEHDSQWQIEVVLPFDVIEQLTGEMPNQKQWFGNFYRCGGRKEPQYGVWSNVDTNEPDYHQPDCFGQLMFS